MKEGKEGRKDNQNENFNHKNAERDHIDSRDNKEENRYVNVGINHRDSPENKGREEIMIIPKGIIIQDKWRKGNKFSKKLLY